MSKQVVHILLAGFSAAESRRARKALEAVAGLMSLIDEAPDAAAAERALHEWPMDMVLLRAKGDGPQMLRSIELLAQVPDAPPVFVVLDNRDQKVFEKAMQAGALDYLLARELGGPVLERMVRYAWAGRSQQRTRLLESAVLHAEDAIMIMQAGDETPGLKIVFVNPAFTRMTGYGLADVAGRSPRLLHGPGTQRAELTRIRQAMNEGHSAQAELMQYRKDGAEFWVDLRSVPIRNERGQVTHFLTVMRDVTARKHDERALLRYAMTDRLTDLPNRALLLDRLDQSLRRARRHHEYRFALLFVDLDDFKEINDTHGHVVGDVLLQEVARRLRAGVRPSDTVARFGGDEFVLLLEEFFEREAIRPVVERMLEVLGRPYELPGGHVVHPSASVGVAIGCCDTPDPADLIRRADLAMYEAKAIDPPRWIMGEEGT